MKRILSITAILVFAFFLLSAFSIRENPQDPPRGKKTEKHIKLVKIDKDGKKVELDTIIKGDNVFVWNGDTIGGDRELKWISKDNFKMDSLHQHLDFEIDEELKHGDHDMMMWHGDKGNNKMIFHAPCISGVPHSPNARGIMFFGKSRSGNVIDLSDPGIISYKKKKISGGRERITIIRNEVKEEDIEKHEEIIIHERHPKMNKAVKIIKSGDGNVEIQNS